jgi:YD repeat-containing protein
VTTGVAYDADTGSSSNPVFDTTYAYNASGALVSAQIDDGRRRTVTCPLSKPRFMCVFVGNDGAILSFVKTPIHERFRRYRRCNPPSRGCDLIGPSGSTARPFGESFSSAR